jgi:hypothetical protein
MKNIGEIPDIDRCDIRFRNGRIRRGIDPKGWRWKPWDTGPSDFDIVDYQPTKDNA